LFVLKLEEQKMIRYFRKSSWLLGLVLVGSLQAQDPIFSQYYATPLQINPAFAGSAFAPRFGIGYRHQWQGFDRAYTTYAGFYEQSLDHLNSGIGFHIEGDDAGNGILKTTRVSGHYAYRLMINKTTGIKIGVEAGAYQSRLDWDKLIFPDQIDPVNGVGNLTAEQRPDRLTRTRLDLSSGLLLFSERLWLGVSLKHLNTPSETFLLVNDNLARGLPIRYTLHGGIDIMLQPDTKKESAAFLSPNFLFVSQGPYQQLNIGSYAGLGSFFAGAWWRHTVDQNADAAIFLVGFRQGIYKIGLTYDATTSRLSGVSGGTYEMTMSFFLDKDENLKKKKKRKENAECPQFFR
jgi:type IX secretion system PorP/SprF family membrane protein